MINFKSIPFFKILFPFLIGICFVFQFGYFNSIHLVFLIVVCLWLIAFLFQKFYQPKLYFKKGIYILLTNCLLFLLAFESCYLYNAKNNNNHYSRKISYKEQQFMATITDLPVASQKFIKLAVQINFVEQNNHWHYAEGNTIIYLKKDSSLQLNLGDNLLVHSVFSHINEPKNPNEFDYKTFLENRNIFHVVYAKTNDVTIFSENNPDFSIMRFGTQIKAYLVSVLRHSNLSQEAFSICSALLVGYDDEIDSDVIQSFSHSGTLHILSVSGMHTGVLYGILIFIFSLFDKQDKYTKTKFVFVLFFLILFVLVTGLSPSVLRAALMLVLILFGKTFYKQGNAYNTLLLSAFILLVFNPYLIKDVGFLLSYMAVFGIMYLYPILAKLYVFKNKILQWLWASVLISVAATVFTLPVSLYFFHQFPIWFVFSNLLIIPISMLIMFAAALFLATYKILFLNQLLVYIINEATNIMLWFAKLTDNSNYGFIDFIPFSKTDALLMMLTIGLILVIIYQKQYKQVLALGITIIAWLSLSIYNTCQQRQKQELLVFHVKQKSVFAMRVGQTVYANFSNLNNKEFQRSVKPYLLSISNLKVVNTSSQFLKSNSYSVFNYSQPCDLIPVIKPNYIVISNDAPLQLTTNYKTPAYIIADCSNSYNFIKKLKKQCNTLNIPFYSVKESGAFYLRL